MINCPKCFAAIPDDMIYCLHCGVKLDAEQETVIRPIMQMEPSQPLVRRKVSITSFIIIFLAFTAALATILIMAAGIVNREKFDKVSSFPTWAADETPTSTPIVQNTNVYVPVAAATPKPSPKAKKTPKSWDDEYERINTAANAKRAKPAPGISAFCNDGTYEWTKVETAHRICSRNGGVQRYVTN